MAKLRCLMNREISKIVLDTDVLISGYWEKSLRVMSKFTLFVISLITVAFISCSSVTEVKIKVKKHSVIDVDKYKKIAVLPFVADSGLTQKDSNEENSDDDKSKKIAFFLRRILSKNKEVNVMDTIKTNSIIAGESIDKALLEDQGRLSDIGGELNVNAVITGKYKFYSASEPRTVPVERYSMQLQRYIRDTITYFHKSYVLSLQVILVDANTGKTVLDEKYEPSVSEAHNIGTLIISEAFQQEDRIFEKLVNEAVLNFAKRIAPHYELEKRWLVE